MIPNPEAPEPDVALSRGEQSDSSVIRLWLEPQAPQPEWRRHMRHVQRKDEAYFMDFRTLQAILRKHSGTEYLANSKGSHWADQPNGSLLFADMEVKSLPGEELLKRRLERQRRGPSGIGAPMTPQQHRRFQAGAHRPQRLWPADDGSPFPPPAAAGAGSASSGSRQEAHQQKAKAQQTSSQ